MSGPRSNTRRQAILARGRKEGKRSRYRRLADALRRVRGQREGVVKIGRNEECPCGSGVKSKKCCGKGV